MKTILISLLVIVAIACNKKKEDNPQPNKTVSTQETKPKTLDSTYYQKLYIDNVLVSTWLVGRGTDTKYNPNITLYTQGTTIDYIRGGYRLDNIDYYFDEKTVIKNYKITGNHISGDEIYYDIKGYVEGKINNKNVRLEFNLSF